MKLYSITLPLHDNAGRDYAMAHLSFQRLLLATCGGYTETGPAQGVWKDDASGVVHIDRVTKYEVATDPEKWASVIQEAGQLFSDQLAFFHYELGTVTITERASSAKEVA